MRTRSIIGLLSLCLASHAQTDSVAPAHNLDEVEVRAFVSAKPLTSTVPFFALPSADFKRLNVSDITSALRRMPGVTLRDYGGAGGMKTVSVRGLGSQHTGVALDGLLLSDVQSGQVDLQQFQLSEISSLTLLVGGDDDIFQPARNHSRASVLSVATAERGENSLTLEGGSWGYGSIATRLSGDTRRHSLGFQGAYTWADNDYPFTIRNGSDTHRERRQNSSLEQATANLSSLWRISSGASLKSSARLFLNDRRLPGVVRLYDNSNEETLCDRGVMVQSMLTTSLAQRWHLKSAVRWNWTDQDYNNHVPSGGIKSERYLQREYYATTALLYQPSATLSMGWAADLWHNAMNTTLSASPRPRRSSFLQCLATKWQPGRVTITAVLLNSNIDSEHRLSPSVSASWRVLEGRDLYVRLGAKEIFRMPTMTELYYYHIGPTVLRPETTRQLNCGITYASEQQEGTPSVRLTADIYINKVEDKIVAIPFNTFVWRFMNVEKVLGRGADVTLLLGCPLGGLGELSLSGNYSWQRVGLKDVLEPFEDYQVAYVPQHSGSVSLAWNNRWCNLTASLTGASRWWTNNEHNGTAMPGYHEIAVSAYRSFRIGGKLLEGGITVQNMLDREYELIARYPMPGRNVKANIKYKF